VYDITAGRYWSAMDRQLLIGSLGLNHVPRIGTGELDADVPTLLQWADGNSQLAQSVRREGLVFKCFEDPSISFKAISNAWLLAHD